MICEIAVETGISPRELVELDFDTLTTLGQILSERNRKR